jgi:hypothetical protein
MLALAGVTACGIALGLVGPDFGLDLFGGASASDLRSVVFYPEPLIGVEP